MKKLFFFPFFFFPFFALGQIEYVNPEDMVIYGRQADSGLCVRQSRCVDEALADLDGNAVESLFLLLSGRHPNGGHVKKTIQQHRAPSFFLGFDHGQVCPHQKSTDSDAAKPLANFLQALLQLPERCTIIAVSQFQSPVIEKK